MNKEVKEFEIYGMWPIFYDNKFWNKWDCSNMFTNYYSCKEAIFNDKSVYVFEDMRVFPDGKIIHN